MHKLLGLHSKVRIYNKENSTVEEVEVIGFGHPPIIRVARPDSFRKEDRIIEVKESDVMSVFNLEAHIWENYSGFNKEIPIPC